MRHFSLSGKIKPLGAFPAGVAKIAIEKGTNFYFSYSFFYTHSNIFYTLFSLHILLCARVKESAGEREDNEKLL
jgi:hypothetical protein